MFSDKITAYDFYDVFSAVGQTKIVYDVELDDETHYIIKLRCTTYDITSGGPYVAGVFYCDIKRGNTYYVQDKELIATSLDQRFDNQRVCPIGLHLYQTKDVNGEVYYIIGGGVGNRSIENFDPRGYYYKADSTDYDELNMSYNQQMYNYLPSPQNYTQNLPAWDLRMAKSFGIDVQTEETSPEAGPPSTEDGYDPDVASFDDSSDTIEIPTAPSIGVSNIGFVNVYKTDANSLQNMGVELFPDLQYTPPQAITGNDTTDAIVNGFNQIVTFLGNIPSFFEQMVANTLINYIIDCHMIPVSPSAGNSESIKVGYKTLHCTGKKVSSDYVTVECGSINLSEYYSNFADFLENAKLFLPFVGFVPARPEWFKRTSLGVTYRFNVIDGSFIAFVTSSGRYVNNNGSNKTIVGQYAGNACVHLPITGVTYSNMVAGLIGGTAGAVASAGSGAIAAAATSAIAAAGSTGDIPMSNSYNSSAAFMGCRRPFLMIERQVSDFSKTYAKENGIPSNISKKIGSITGVAILGDVHLDGITATDTEKAEIERLLHEGVIL